MKYLVVEQNYEYNDEGYDRTEGYSALFVTNAKKLAEDKVSELTAKWMKKHDVDEIEGRLYWQDRERLERTLPRDTYIHELEREELLAKMKELNITIDLYNIEEVEEL